MAAPLSRYAREWRLATSPKPAERAAALRAPLLARAFNETARALVGKRVTWHKCADDPTALVIWGARQAGWRIENGMTLIDDQGVDRSLIFAAPQHVRRAATDAVTAARANAACSKAVGAGSHAGEGAANASIWTAPIRRALASRGAGAMDALERGCAPCS